MFRGQSHGCLIQVIPAERTIRWHWCNDSCSRGFDIMIGTYSNYFYEADHIGVIYSFLFCILYSQPPPPRVFLSVFLFVLTRGRMLVISVVVFLASLCLCPCEASLQLTCVFISPVCRECGLAIQGIEPSGRIHKNGRFRVNDVIVEINGHSLLKANFAQ